MSYKFGQIFRLEHPSGDNDFYILACNELGMFTLVNLVDGSKMSDPVMCPPDSFVPKSLVEQHAEYFLQGYRAVNLYKGCKLIPLKDCKLSYTDDPIFIEVKGEAPIGYGSVGGL